MQSLITLAGRVRARLHWNQDHADLVLGIGLTGFAIFTAQYEHYRLDPIAWVLLLIQTVPICWRRRNPFLILFLTGGSIVLYSALGYRDANGSLGVFVAFYTIAANVSRREAVRAAVITALGILISFVAYITLNSVSNWPASLTANYLLFGLAWVIGDNLRVRRAYTRELEERAARLEHEREEQAARAVSEERSRIARELHDVVAHYVSVMVVQAGGARRVVDRDPEAARGALAAIENAGRTALAEMRRMLSVLREDEGGLDPQPGLGDIERLVDQVREAGVPVVLSVEGERSPLPPGMDLAAYRIVQEALTNTVKHAGKAAARVAIRQFPEVLEIEVSDDGRGAAAPLLSPSVGGGQGLIGMRERVALFGGQLTTGPVFPGGYRVLARLPIEPEERARAVSAGAVPAAAGGADLAGADGMGAAVAGGGPGGAGAAGLASASGGFTAGRGRTRAPDERRAPRRPVAPMMIRVVPPRRAAPETPDDTERNGDLA
jgi:signal transduction histidine kinase